MFVTQAYFFDFDHDGDLDLFLLNHNPKSLPVLDDSVTFNILKQNNPETGVRLFRNDDNHFVDITSKAGFSSSSLTYGLGAGVADLNGDGWQDIYISNDYNVPDYLYINNHNGTFTNVLQKSVGHTSQFSMGNDVADINNDALPDIFTLDMLPADNRRQKLLVSPDNYGKFDLMLQSGFYYQYMRNMLQLNNGDGTFSEIGQLANVSNTDWSWAPLLADYDNDGWKDLFVTNGYLRDFTNMDFIKYMNDYVKSAQRMDRSDVLKLIDSMPASNVVNYLFKNNGNLTFTDIGKQSGIDQPSNSNGAVYVDLDNDGDLDLVTNNINQPAFIYENGANHQKRNTYLEINLSGLRKNTFGIGAKITVYVKGRSQFLEQMPMRGFQSSVSPVLHFGLGVEKMIDSLRIVWPGGACQVLRQVRTNQSVTLYEKQATGGCIPMKTPVPLFTGEKSAINFAAQTKPVNDFLRQSLMVSPMSFFAPCLAKADVNGDGFMDVYAGGEIGQEGALFLGRANGSFSPISEPAFENDKMSEDVDAVFFDANGDGYQDLYVCSGGYDGYMPGDVLLQDRLYINDGKGNFVKSSEALPEMHTSTSCVRVGDVNGDGFPDLFVGGRVVPGRYPEIPESYLLINDGRGHFSNEIVNLAPALQKIGMVTDAAWVDLNGDGKKDLIVAGEWMPLTVFINNNGHLEDKTDSFFDKSYKGWWNRLLITDVNSDGKPDIVAGNFGTNSQCRVNEKEPAELYFKDFDNNGTIDPVLCFYIQHKSYPYVTRDEMINQVPLVHTRFPTFKSYADATINDIFTPGEMAGAARLEANELKTSLFISGSDGKFHNTPMPVECQFSPVFTITELDYDNDGKKDLLLCGNINHARLRFGKSDANYGILLKGDGRGNFTYIPQRQSGFHIRGDVRSVLQINGQLFFGLNQDSIKSYKMVPVKK